MQPDPQTQIIMVLALGLLGGPLGFALIEVLKPVLKSAQVRTVVAGIVCTAIAAAGIAATGKLPWAAVIPSALLAWLLAFGVHKLRNANESASAKPKG